MTNLLSFMCEYLFANKLSKTDSNLVKCGCCFCQRFGIENCVVYQWISYLYFTAPIYPFRAIINIGIMPHWRTVLQLKSYKFKNVNTSMSLCLCLNPADVREVGRKMDFIITALPLHRSSITNMALIEYLTIAVYQLDHEMCLTKIDSKNWTIWRRNSL